MKILIGTPIYDSQVLARYHGSILGLLSRFRSLHPDIAFENCLIDGTLVARARNGIASLFLANESLTHLLFVDADMGFHPDLIRKMLAFNAPIVGVVYPRRQQDPARIVTVAREVSDPALCGPIAQSYVGEEDLLRDDTGALVVDRGFIRMKRLGTGIMLIQRSALERMKQAYPDLVVQAERMYRTMGLEGDVFQAFESFPGPDGVYYSEDYAFCQRWVDGCNGELWAVVDETIFHVGRQEFAGNYLAKLRHQFGPGRRG